MEDEMKSLAKIFTAAILCVIAYVGYINTKNVYLQLDCTGWLSFENNMELQERDKEILKDISKKRANACRKAISFEYHNTTFIFKFDHEYNEEDFK